MRRTLWIASFAIALLAISREARSDGAERLSALDPERRTALLDLVKKGETLDEAGIAEMRKRLEADPKDAEARLLLMGSSSRDPKTKREYGGLAVGLVEQHFADDVGDASGLLLGLAGVDATLWGNVSDAWSRFLTAHPDDVRVAGNAGAFWTSRGRPDEEITKGLGLLVRAHAAQPDERRWLLRLVEREDRLAAGDRYPVLLHYQAALPEAEARKARVSGAKLLAQRIAETAWEAKDAAAAERHARSLLSWASRESLEWDYGNVVHEMNVLLGRIALAAGDVAAAKERLLDAGRAAGSPQLDSFGPDWSLAAELLRKGERGAVLSYLDLCAKFWTAGATRLARWRKTIEDGGVPDFPVEKQPSPKPSPAPGTPPEAREGPARPLVGLWESESKSSSGMGSAYEFREDGTFRLNIVIFGGEVGYRVEGDQLVMRPPPGEGEEVKMPLGQLEGDTWTLQQAGRKVTKQRLAAGPAGSAPIVGVWKYEIGPAAYYFERWSADGRATMRMPMPIGSGGRWRIEGGTLHLDIPGKPADALTFRIRGDVLTLTDSQGKVLEYRWAGEKAWYPL